MENELQQMNPELLKEMETFSREPMLTELPALPENEMTAAAVKVPPVINLIPNPPGVKNIKNWCGQAAVTAVVDVLGKNIYKDSNKLQHLFNDVYKWFAPDILHGAFGTSANRIVSALKNYGLKNTVSLRLEPWLAGGFANPVNLASFAAYSNMVFKYVNAGYPAIVMVDNGKLGDNWYVYHWLVLYGTNSNEVFLCNAVDKTSGYHYKRINIHLFNQAWEASSLLLPGFRFNAVIAVP